MKQFVWNYTEAGTDTYRVSWYEKSEQGTKELCSTTVRITGGKDAARASLAYVAADLQREKSDLFVIEPEEMDPMRMEGENVQH